jgi:hypothetical protein
MGSCCTQIKQLTFSPKEIFYELPVRGRESPKCEKRQKREHYGELYREEVKSSVKKK